MGSINKLFLLGNVGKDPKIKVMENGRKMATFSLATTERWTDREGKAGERTDWHFIRAYGARAEFVERHVRKGAALCIEAKLRHDQWKDEENEYELIYAQAIDIQFAGPKGSENNRASQAEPESPNQHPQAGGYDDEDMGPAFPSDASDVPF